MPDTLTKEERAAIARAEQQERRDMWWIVALIVGPMIAVLAFAAYADPVARLAHDTARPEYCGAC